MGVIAGVAPGWNIDVQQDEVVVGKTGMWNGALSIGTGLSSSWADAGCASAQESANNDAEMRCFMEFLPV